jgi:5-methylcytosine-specific restriction protein A
MIRRICRASACLTLVDPPRSYCSKHQGYEDAKLKRESERATQRWADHHARVDYSWIWRDARWRKIRAAQLRDQPTCQKCGAPGTTVDHVIPHRGEEALAFDRGNVQTLCGSCHARKTREDRA